MGFRRNQVPVMVKGFIAASLCLVAGCAGAVPKPSALVAIKAVGLVSPRVAHPAQETSDDWYRAGSIAAHQRGAGRERARNIILFIGDGMSLTTVAAARILEGQRRGQAGEENQLSFEEFGYTALSRTYNTDSQTPDSAGTTTAMIAGAKTRMGMLGVGQAAARGDCQASRSQWLASALELAEVAGLATGVVTNTRLTHATPAATYAHVPEREWESDSDLSASANADGCHDIARQFAEFDLGDGIEVAMGGGRKNFLPAGAEDPEYAQETGTRLDGRNLINEWQQRYPDGSYVWNLAQLQKLDLSRTHRLLGLFEPDHLKYEHDRATDAAGEPSLAEMTATAIAVLRHNRRGFFLVVEGGRIDHAHHAGNAFRALDETIALSDAVRVAVAATSPSDTLVMVTADHSHTLNFVGYSRRGNPILGKAVGSSGEDASTRLATDASGLPYTTLSYANGPGYAGATDQQPEGPKRFPHLVSGAQAASSRPNLREVDTESADFLQESMMPIGSETHGGDDVGIWARGPGASAVRGSLEQNVIFHLLVQSQADMVRLLCSMGNCEQGVPVRRPQYDQLRAATPPAQAR